MLGVLARTLFLVAVAACSFEPDAVEPPSSDLDPEADAAEAPDPGCAACPANDQAAGAIDVSGGMQGPVDVSDARDDVTASCAAAGGADVFFQVTLSAAEVLYVDTFDSDYDTAVSVHRGGCASLGEEVACVDDGCSGRSESQLAVSLEAGDYCVVVDQGRGVAAPARLSLRVARGHWPGQPVARGATTLTGNTCESLDRVDPPCEILAINPGAARDDVYFFTVCPGEMQGTVSTCGASHFDSIVYLRSALDESEICNDNGCGLTDWGSDLSPTITGPDLVYLIVDGWDGQCGAYELTLEL